jgi:hypothetical protein
MNALTKFENMKFFYVEEIKEDGEILAADIFPPLSRVQDSYITAEKQRKCRV